MGCFRAGLTCVHPGWKGAPFPNSHKGAAWALLGQAGCGKWKFSAMEEPAQMTSQVPPA